MEENVNQTEKEMAENEKQNQTGKEVAENANLEQTEKIRGLTAPAIASGSTGYRQDADHGAGGK